MANQSRALGLDLYIFAQREVLYRISARHYFVLAEHGLLHYILHVDKPLGRVSEHLANAEINIP